MIGTTYCKLSIKSIDGLYIEDTFAPCSKYKILHNREIVTKIKELPESFKDLTTIAYTNEDFHIKIHNEDLELDKHQEEPTLNQSLL